MKKASAKVRRARSEDLFFNDLVRTKDGLISPQIFVDPQIAQLELERIFARSWLFVAHESEIPQAGDYVTRVMGEDTVIVWRGQDGKIRVFLNVCRHRGRKICGDDGGKASHFRCPYHGWTYNNRGELIAVPFFDDYHGRLEKDSLGLYQTPGVDTYHGLIFANWNANAEPLGEYLGEMKWALDLMFGRTDGLEVLGPPMKWVVEGNWKVGAANFSGDPVHLFTTHGFGAALGLENKQREQRLSYKLTTENGHAASLSLRGSSDKFFLGLPEELWPEMELHLTCEQVELMKRLSTIVGNVFPNMSFLNSSSRLPGEWGGGEGPMSFLNLRLFQPRGANSMEVWSWLFVDKNAPGYWKEASRECYIRTFGMAGVYEQDDTENYAQIRQGLRGAIAKRLWLQYKLGLGRPPAAKEIPVSGVSNLEPWSFGEDNERVFYGYWWKLIKPSGAGQVATGLNRTIKNVAVETKDND